MRYDVQDKGDCFGNAEKYKDICNRPPDTERLIKALGVEAFAAGAKEAFGAHVIPSSFTPWLSCKHNAKRPWLNCGPFSFSFCFLDLLTILVWIFVNTDLESLESVFWAICPILFDPGSHVLP